MLVVVVQNSLATANHAAHSRRSDDECISVEACTLKITNLRLTKASKFPRPDGYGRILKTPGGGWCQRTAPRPRCIEFGRSFYECNAYQTNINISELFSRNIVIISCYLGVSYALDQELLASLMLYGPPCLSSAARILLRASSTSRVVSSSYLSRAVLVVFLQISQSFGSITSMSSVGQHGPRWALVSKRSAACISQRHQCLVAANFSSRRRHSFC